MNCVPQISGQVAAFRRMARCFRLKVERQQGPRNVLTPEKSPPGTIPMAWERQTNDAGGTAAKPGFTGYVEPASYILSFFEHQREGSGK